MSFTPFSPFSSPSPERRQQELRVQRYSEQLQLPIPKRFADYSQRDLDATEGFLRYLLTLEQAPSSTLAKQLIRDGIELPPPDALDDASISKKLEEVILGLANLRTYLTHTDHLSDRQLYEHLWLKDLNDPEYEFDEHMGDFQTTIDFVGDCSDESMKLYHRFYADELDRDWWMSENPDYEMPEMEPAPYDRDSHLPHPPF